jgi:TATA-box binding protein (TBP) (component of TFIID and TFIIIB)
MSNTPRLRVCSDLLPYIKSVVADTEGYHERMQKHNETLVNIQATDFIVSTMTFVIRLDITKVDIENLAERWNDPDVKALAQHMGHPMTIALPDKKARSKAAKRVKVERSQEDAEPAFYNQVTLRVVDAAGKKAVKIFVNGVLHLAGAKSIKDAVAITHSMCMLLEHICRVPRVEASEMQICMINTNFSIDKRLRLKECKNLLNCMGKNCSYDPEGYPAASFKHENVSIFVFATGKVIVTGGKSFSDVFTGYSFIVSLIDTNLENLETRPLNLVL